MRVYLPLVPSTLADLSAAGVLPGPLTAYTVTGALSRWVHESARADPGHADDLDAEEYEYAALGEASRESLRRLAGGDMAADACRVVVAADVGDRSVLEVADGWPGEVRLTDPLTRSQVVSVHVDDLDAADAVRAAAAAVGLADDGDEAAELVVGAADDAELLWYAAEELTLLVGERRFGR